MQRLDGMGGSPVSRIAVVSQACEAANARLPPPALGEPPKLVGFQRAEGERLALHRGATPGVPVQNERPRTEARGRSPNNAGSDLLSHTVSHAVPSAVSGLTSVFGMGTGVTLIL
jgi:hypothetical protein